ncbi:MAG: peptidylprolyl isomerase [Methanobrevibacter thaueri]|nr:peptidylprolyl isomerase [Methanobrevibacter thaueri]
MAINKGDFVRVNFTGKIKNNDEVYDTTYEEIAQEAGIFDDKRVYKPIPIIVGGNHLLPTLEEGIIDLEVGDKKTIEVESKDAFGPRDSSLVRLMPMKEFKKQGMTPFPGMKIQAEGTVGKVLTVNGGRVKVDFNHELAGKDLVYDIEVVEVMDDVNDKVKAMIEFRSSNPNMDVDKTEIELNDGVLNIKLDDVAKFDQKSYMDVTFERFNIAKDLYENIDEINKVNFIDSFEKPEKEDEESEE